MASSRPVDALGAGTKAGQGTLPLGINPAGQIAGTYIDSTGVAHGFLRAPDGKIAPINAPGAGNGAGQGTTAYTIDAAGEIVGYYADANNVNHAFLLTP
jgi:hypothetical protein